jgi:membrane protein involved in colicin uptake
MDGGRAVGRCPVCNCIVVDAVLIMADDDSDHKIERRRGPSTSTLSFSGIIAVAGLLASGVATYNAVQNDIASLKRGELYQERTNERLSEELKSVRVEQRETMKEFNEKLDRIIDQWARGRKQ